MSTLENIIDKILQDANEKKEIIFSELEEEKTRLEKIEDERIKEEEQRILDSAKREAKDLLKRELSIVQLKARDIELEAKQDMITKVLEAVISRLENLSKEDYLSYLEKALEELKPSKDAKVFVEDRFLDYIHNAKLDYNISEETVQSGFKVSDGNINYNNDFRSIVESQREEVESKILTTLFGE